MRTRYCRVVMEIEFRERGGGGALGCALWVCGWLWEAGGMRACAKAVTTDFLYRARSSVSWSCRAHPKPVQSTPYEATSLFTFTHVTSVKFIRPNSQPICLRSVLVLWHLLLGLATFCLCELDKQHTHTCSNCN